MTTEQWIIYVGSAIASVGASIWAIVKFVIPRLLEAKLEQIKFEAAEAAKQREYDRAQQEARAAAEQSEQVALWESMVKLQTQTLNQNELLLEFVMTMATESLKSLAGEVRDGQRDVLSSWEKATYEMRELRTSLRIIVNEITEQARTREALSSIPAHLLKFQELQHDHHRRVVELLTEGKPCEVDLKNN